MSRFGTRNPNVQITLHDVMPNTLERIAEQIILLERHRLAPGGLLVVPGLPWSKKDLRWLRRWSERGWELVGHGWVHRCRSIEGFRHRLHSLVISRDCAEHLALNAHQIVDLMRRCRRWFEQHSLALPSAYVPPAWALGSVPIAALAETGFERVETLTGWWDLNTCHHRKMALVGFEADTRSRARVLGLLNALNSILHSSGMGLRLALHPHDHVLHLCTHLEARLRQLAPAEF